MFTDTVDLGREVCRLIRLRMPGTVLCGLSIPILTPEYSRL
jgi:hypothetical protein